MRITFRLIVSLVTIVTLVVVLFTALQVWHGQRLLMDDLARRSAVVGEVLQDRIVPILNTGHATLWEHGFLRWLLQALLISLATLVIIRWNITAPLS